MSVDEIRAKAIEVLARANLVAHTFRDADGYLSTAIHTDEEAAQRAVDALAAAGLLPTIVEETEIGVWGTDRYDRRQVRYVTDWQEVGE
ncbi:hypothetical protein IU451_28680 [Nocardia cyriacigeorgica]|uniref:hypothetical protein n=1 Tax=Nocardia cyriacigeorgica TaxID=135487 RepID=UPI0018953CFD|nr:hypothetical protein [Nocardia cyriacigeorgica]MBF6326478.1 hypothetical protein [Nocardia cyriacigeorgica]